MQIGDLIRVALGEFVENVRRNMATTGTDTTGKTSESLRAEVTQRESGCIGVVYARPFFKAVETGTRPWKHQYAKPPKFFIEIIKEWAENKGVTASPGAIAYTIMKKGSRLYRTGGRTDIFTNEIPTTIDKIAKETIGVLNMEVKTINDDEIH